MEAPVSTWFRNLKNLPIIGTPEYDDLVDQEIDRCKGGIEVNAVHISGWLYFHLNHWHIRIDSQDEYGNDVRISQYPDLRDNEWIRAEALEQCRILRKGYMEIGLRQGGKSEAEASFTAYNALMFENTQNVVVGGNAADLSLITDKLDHGLNNMWEGIAIPRIDKDWKKPMVRLGYKDKKNNDVIWSYIVIRNADSGDNTEAPAGTTSKSFIMDEVGKYGFGQTFEAAKPAFLSQFGWRTIPFLVGTGGSFQKGADAERFFNNPDSNNFLAFVDKTTGKKTCLFLSGLYRQDCKYETDLACFLREKYQMDITENSELSQIKIRVSDKELALNTIKQERITKSRDPDRTEYLKVIMYHPLTPEECFLSAENNMFNIEAAKKQKERLISDSLFGTPVEIINDGEGLSHRFTDKKPILEYPISANADKDGCVVMYEPPIKNAPFGLYVAGCLTPGEKVITNRGLVSVEEVTLNDKLLNKEGVQVDIINLQRYYKKDSDIYRLKVSNTIRTTTFTKEHPIYINKRIVKDNGRFSPLKLDSFNFIESEKVEVGDWIKVPNIYKEKLNIDIDSFWIDLIREDFRIESPLKQEDFWWLIGLFLGDGWTNTDPKGNIKISFAINFSEKEYVDKLILIINKLFNRKVSSRVRNNCYEITFSSKSLGTFLNTHFKKYAHSKIIPEWVKKIDANLKKSLLLGYLDSDGCVTYNSRKNLYNLEFVSISLELLEGIQDILFSLGIVSNANVLREEGITTFKGHSISKTRKTYHVRVSNEGSLKFRKYFSCPVGKLSKVNINSCNNRKKVGKGCFISNDENYIYFRITSIEKFQYTGWVYNFECDSHTYLCKHITTHNCDPYKQDESKYSDSLGSIFIFKRMHNITTEKYQDMFVAEYTGRTRRFNDWAEIARNLIKYYNAIALVESEDYAFIRYMLDKGEYRYLMPQPPWLKMISPNTSVNRDFGLPATPRVIAQLNGTLKTYTEEIILTEYDENRVPIKEYLGMTKVLSLPLLDEMSKFNADGNFDRIRAASMAIEAARRMDADNIRPESVDGDPRLKSYFNQHKKTNHIVKTFGQSSPSLLNSKNKSVARLLS